MQHDQTINLDPGRDSERARDAVFLAYAAGKLPGMEPDPLIDDDGGLPPGEAAARRSVRMLAAALAEVSEAFPPSAGVRRLTPAGLVPAVKEVRLQFGAAAGAFVRIDMAPGSPIEWFGNTWPSGDSFAALTPLLDAAARGASISLDDLHRARGLAVQAHPGMQSPR